MCLLFSIFTMYQVNRICSYIHFFDYTKKKMFNSLLLLCIVIDYNDNK